MRVRPADGVRLRCSWCDTPYAFHEGRKVSVDDVVAQVAAIGCDYVEITGGEPLLQPDVYPLMAAAASTRGQRCMLETGGHRSIADVPPEVIRIIDVKCPGSGEAAKNHWPNLDRPPPDDEVKFVIQDRADYEFARDVVAAPRSDRAHAPRCCSLRCTACWTSKQLRRGSSRIGWRSGCSCRCTSSSGALRASEQAS